jgi:hypothetical protein
MERTAPRKRETLDGQLVDYWSREAARLDVLASQARFGWQRRRFERKAEKARAQSDRSRAREARRGPSADPAIAEVSQG